jgi:transcription elongation factor GreB
MSGDEEEGAPLPPGTKNYMSPAGHARLVAERNALAREERPRIVEIVSSAAG